MTFTFDEETVEKLRRAALRVCKPQSAVAREAIREYAERIGRLSTEERGRMLAVVDRVIARPRTRSEADVDAEIAAIRATRGAGGRRRKPRKSTGI